MIRSRISSSIQPASSAAVTCSLSTWTCVSIATASPDARVKWVGIVIAGGLCLGLAHAYQGWGGMAMTAVVGCALGGLYAASGSLLLPILLHAALDARGALLSRANLGEA
jgi:uncharacterized protein